LPDTLPEAPEHRPSAISSPARRNLLFSCSAAIFINQKQHGYNHETFIHIHPALRQQRQISILAASLKEQASLLQKVSAQNPGGHARASGGIE
jgi:hypothetical protein